MEIIFQYVNLKLSRSTYGENILMQKFKIFYLGKQHGENTWHIKSLAVMKCTHEFSYFSLTLFFFFMQTLFFFPTFLLPQSILNYNQCTLKWKAFFLTFLLNYLRFTKLSFPSLLSLLFPFPLSLLFVWAVMVLWFSSAQIWLFLTHSRNSFPFISKFPENAPISTCEA